eukprot:87885-Chlamydomonas_euryale.AAC.7
MIEVLSFSIGPLCTAIGIGPLCTAIGIGPLDYHWNRASVHCNWNWAFGLPLESGLCALPLANKNAGKMWAETSKVPSTTSCLWDSFRILRYPIVASQGD